MVTFSALAGTSSIRDIDIMVSLMPDGTARITERWDISVSEGTEWYLVRSNLGDIRVRMLYVTDETGLQYEDEGAWDVDRSLQRKAGRYGLVTKRDGVEICWGLGSFGSHVYTVCYEMTNAVKSLHDYDMLHLQLVSPGLSARPEHVRVTVEAPGTELSELNSRIWGFGYNGTMNFSSGKVVAESSERFSSNSSVIALIRFDKGIFSSPSIQDRDFQSVLDIAFEGSSFGDEDDMSPLELAFVVLFGLLFFGFGIFAIIWSVRHEREKIIGVKSEKEVQWCRNIPFSGDILKSYYVLKKLQQIKGANSSAKGNTLASAIILKMVNLGVLSVSTDARDKVEISFNDTPALQGLSGVEQELYAMMKEASGSDVILQDKEFSRWSNRHQKRVGKWVDSIDPEALRSIRLDGGLERRGTFTPQTREKAREVVGFRKFLSDFTLVGERRTSEVALWNDYMVFASLFGIADQVAKELKDIDPKSFQEVMPMDPYTYGRLMRMSTNLGNAITSADTSAKMQAASKGLGGVSSFGGGGGFSGGGFGGGAR